VTPGLEFEIDNVFVELEEFALGFGKEFRELSIK